jgi:hypothetical protein
MPQARRRPKTHPVRSRNEVKRLVYEAFRKEFPEDTVDLSDGYKENIHVMVVSREFDRMREREKQDLMWKIIDSTDLSEDEKGLISLVFPVSPAEIK